MNKEKKDALTLACKVLDDFVDCSNSWDIYCPLEDKCNIELNCGMQLKQYFQQQADIPDGWDVVKEIYKKIKQDRSRHEEGSHDAWLECDHLIDFIEYLYKESGKEIHNE